MNGFWKTLVIITCLLSVIAIFVSIGINIESISVEGVDVLAWAVGILQISIAVIAILFAYNVISFEKRVKEKIQEAENKLKTELDDAIKKFEVSFNSTIALVQAQMYAQLQQPFEASFWYLEFLRRTPKESLEQLSKEEIAMIKEELNKLREQEIPLFQKEIWLQTLYGIYIKDKGIEDLISSVNSLKAFDLKNI